MDGDLVVYTPASWRIAIDRYIQDTLFFILDEELQLIGVLGTASSRIWQRRAQRGNRITFDYTT